ncbi:DUF2207 domain-containing protein [Sedimenticola selenatireducens]|uniref:DUF2207 domain-containing protein n=1 Tax=Sedimenticola selenatireducens TaxID=191960 RepID=UPI00048E7F51|nr:DUF2207 domain-containing protein [Sedimenticola selenatireducens]
MARIILRLCLPLLLALSNPGMARERILDYFSDIQVQRDGSMVVEEAIEVRAEGNKIRRGIFRDFPTDYKDRLGKRYRVGFELLEVRRDGHTEPYHTEAQSNGIRIYIGNKNVILKPGVYRYTLRYRTNRQLGFFDDHDELYWNVTGNGWDFPIERAAARVTLPPGIPVDAIQVEGYTGAKGDRGKQYSARVDGNGDALFETTTPLPVHHGLTLVTSWPKGHVIEPDTQQRLTWFLSDNQGFLITGGGILLLLGYFTAIWYRVGRDPDIGVIIPLYTPPKGYSPAAMRYIKQMGYDHQAFGAAVVNMAVSGYLRIKEDKAGKFTLEKTGKTPTLAPGEGAIASALFGGGNHKIRLHHTNHQKMSKALEAHKTSLKRDYEKTYFVTNSGFIVPGLLITLALLGAGLWNVGSEEKLIMGAFMMVWLSIWSVAVFKMAVGIYQSWRDARSSGIGSYAKAIGSTLFALPFFAGEVFGIGMLTFAISLPFTLMLLLAIAINVLFYEWLKAPTRAGQQLLQKVEGFKQYLGVAERDELNFKHPPDKTPALFEAYLPYALALGVEQQWAERFSQVLAAAGQDGHAYHPAWYSGKSWNSHNLTGFSGAVGSAMSSAISSSSHAPGSSSGSGGGGSSGGGGGGGGGGGW